MRLRIPFVSRRTDGGQDTADRLDIRPGVPWWVPIFTDWGRPIAAVVVLVLCAPGEQHLADLAGWNETLSWGFAGLLSLYAGISAVVATVRPRGARGKATAVLGAVLSLALAMAAQPVSHLFVTGWLSAEPRPPFWLVVSVSMIPPFILGHLLHLAASPVRAAVPDKADRPARPAGKPVAVPSWATEEKARRKTDKVPAPAVRPVSLLHPDRRTLSAPDRTARPVSLADKQKMSVRALELAQTHAGQDKDAIKRTVRDTLKTEYPDAKADSVRKAAERAADKVSAAS